MKDRPTYILGDDLKCMCNRYGVTVEQHVFSDYIRLVFKCNNDCVCMCILLDNFLNVSYMMQILNDKIKPMLDKLTLTI